MQTILDEAATLTDAERAQLMQVLAPAKVNGDALEGEELVYDVIKEHLDEVGLDTYPYHVFRARHNYGDFRRGAKIVLDYVGRMRPKGRAEFRKGIIVLVRMLLRRLERDGITCSIGVVMKNLQRVPAIVDDAYPGYRVSGMLNWLITKTRRTV